MSRLQDKHLYEIVIPGTHDSGTEGFPTISPSRTQVYKINEQLEGGVRFLDMRLAYNSVEDNFHVVHGTDVASNLNFDTVVKWCNDFLSLNPTETIVMSIKQEGLLPGPDDAFARELSSWHTTHANNHDWKSDLWYTTDSAIPTVEQAKGKIVLVKRYKVSNQSGAPLFFGGFDFTFINGNQSGGWTLLSPQSPSPQNPYVLVQVQDEYKYEGEAKKDAVEGFIESVMGGYVMPSPPNYVGWGINFASSANPTPYQAAEVVNPWLAARLRQITGKLYGVLLTDYAQPALWQQIYGLNFN